MGAPPISLRAAAKLLGIKPPMFISILRDAGILLANKMPRPDLIKDGIFMVEPRCFELENGIRKHYQVALVTIQGLAWLDQRINSKTLRKVS